MAIAIALLFNEANAQHIFNFSSDADYERIYVEAGIFQPLGKLSNQFEASPSFGFWFRSKIQKNDFLDLGFNFFIPKNPVQPLFKYRDTEVNYKSKYFGANIGTRFARVFPISKKSSAFNLEWSSGLGVALNVYSAPNNLEFEK